MKKVKRKYKQWTQEEVEELKNLVNEGKCAQEIGDILDRSVNNVRYGMRKIGIKSKAVSKNKNKPSVNKKPHVYNIGQEVNGLIIKSQTRYGKTNHRAYEVQSITYPNAPTYIAYEHHLVNGAGDAYLTGRRVCEETSLYAKEYIREYLVDVEESKTIGAYTTKKVKAKCPHCDKIKVTFARDLTNLTFSCKICSKGISYPELLFISYLEVKNIPYETQVTYPDLNGRIFDFRVTIQGVVYLVETHGMQHYEDVNTKVWRDAYSKTLESDNVKRQYCIDNSIPLIELDCRKSEFKFIKDEISSNTVLPSIDDAEVKKILKLIETNKRYDNNLIKKLYSEGETTTSIGDKLGISYQTVNRILRRNGVKIKGTSKRKVRCVNTGVVYESVNQAARELNVAPISIGKVCNKKRGYNSAGKLNGEKLRWEYVDNE